MQEFLHQLHFLKSKERNMLICIDENNENLKDLICLQNFKCCQLRSMKNTFSFFTYHANMNRTILRKYDMNQNKNNNHNYFRYTIFQSSNLE